MEGENTGRAPCCSCVRRDKAADLIAMNHFDMRCPRLHWHQRRWTTGFRVGGQSCFNFVFRCQLLFPVAPSIQYLLRGQPDLDRTYVYFGLFGAPDVGVYRDLRFTVPDPRPETQHLSPSGLSPSGLETSLRVPGSQYPFMQGLGTCCLLFSEVLFVMRIVVYFVADVRKLRCPALKWPREMKLAAVL